MTDTITSKDLRAAMGNLIASLYMAFVTAATIWWLISPWHVGQIEAGAVLLVCLAGSRGWAQWRKLAAR